jgi:hypothetical protein
VRRVFHKNLLPLFAGILAIAMLSARPSLWACIHLPEQYDGSFQAQSQQSIIFHDGKTESLIVKLDSPVVASSPTRPGSPTSAPSILDIPTAATASGGSPRSLSMVAIFPVPAAPARVELSAVRLGKPGDPERVHGQLASQLFEQLKTLVDETSANPFAKGRSLAAAGAAPAPEVVIGPYGITKFSNSAADLAALDRWITARTVQTSSGTNVASAPVRPLDTRLPAFQYYLTGNWTFCAIRLLDTSRAITPVQISFPARRIFWPIKLMAGGTRASLARTGSYTVYTLTRAGSDLTPLREDMAQHLMPTVHGRFERGTGQTPVLMDRATLNRYGVIGKLIASLGERPGNLQLMRFQGSFLGREAGRFKADVFASTGPQP